MNAREDQLAMWVIYDHPRDFPRHWVVREWRVGIGELLFSAEHELFDDVEHARAWLQQTMPGLMLVQRAGDDPDPVVFEVYV